MIFLLLTVACTLSFGVLFKIAGLHAVDGLGLVTGNYIVASVGVGIGLFFEVEPVAQAIGPKFVLLGVTTGLLFVGGFVLLALATRTAGMSLALSVMRVSVVIPFTYSWLYWGEVPTDLQLLGLGIACVAFFLITRASEGAAQPTAEPIRNRSSTIVQSGFEPASAMPSLSQLDSAATVIEETSVSGPLSARIPVRSLAVLSLVLLFISGGLTDVSMKTFDEVFVGLHSRWQFMAFVFGTAALTGLIAMGLTGRFSRKILSRRLLLLALILGVVNVASVQFLLQAIEALSGTFVFPVLNISVVVGGALMGVLIWHERLSRLNRWGIVLAVVALLLMQI